MPPDRDVLSDQGAPPAGFRPDAVKLPNGCWLEPGCRVRIPKHHLDAALAAHPSISREPNTASHESVVVYRPWVELPASSDEEGRSDA